MALPQGWGWWGFATPWLVVKPHIPSAVVITMEGDTRELCSAAARICAGDLRAQITQVVQACLSPPPPMPAGSSDTAWPVPCTAGHAQDGAGCPVVLLHPIVLLHFVMRLHFVMGLHPMVLLHPVVFLRFMMLLLPMVLLHSFMVLHFMMLLHPTVLLHPCGTRGSFQAVDG